MKIETFVAFRYLRPRRGRGLLSVVTAIAVVGFAAGVGALILALAITNGFRDALQQELVGATADVNLLRKDPAGFTHYREMLARLRALPHVAAAAPVVYDEVFLSRGSRGAQATLKGVFPDQELKVGDLLRKLAAGSLAPIARDPSSRTILLGRDLAQALGAAPGDYVEVYVPRAVLTPLGYVGRTVPFQVAGIFQSGFADFDSGWAFTGFTAIQQLHPDYGGIERASSIEFRADNIYNADLVAAEAQRLAGPDFTTTTWISQNRPIFQALQIERLGTILVIGLIVLVAALNVLIMLTMLVMEKRKEIAVLLSLGARRNQIRRIFLYQGLAIATLGTGAGLVFAYVLAWAANHFRWIPLSASVYAVNYVPFHAHWQDGIWVSLLALGVTVVATIYPAARAVSILPVETLRYE